MLTRIQVENVVLNNKATPRSSGDLATAALLPEFISKILIYSIRKITTEALQPKRTYAASIYGLDGRLLTYQT